MLLASVLDLVGGSHKIQDEIAKKGLARSQQFSWQRTAQETLAVYNSLR
jgi:glycosyltransferase involved in cell wall biosynthesis